MGKRFDQMLFPGGKTKALTLSYDDAVVQDRRLVALMNQYGVKGTFNVGSRVLGFQGEGKDFEGRSFDISKIPPEEVKRLYEGQEVGGHGLYHSSLPHVGTPLAMREIIEDKVLLEDLTGAILTMFAYPFGAYDDNVRTLLRLAGYHGARTVKSTHGFAIPEDFLVWDPTCHHDDPNLMKLIEDFCEGKAFRFGPSLFYLWGHAYEFDQKDHWDVIERFLKYVQAFKDRIWFATNGEIMAYVEAFRSLQYSADGHLIRNPSALTVWLGVPGTLEENGEERFKVYTIQPGETAQIAPTSL